jgi:curved DNA-binding protein CbpA
MTNKNNQDLYALLELANGKNSSAAQIKKAYYSLALKYHPDKQASDELKSAHVETFQKLSHAYSILSDENKRKKYDQTGSVVEGEFGGFDWRLYFDGSVYFYHCYLLLEVFGKVTAQDIEDYSKIYKGVL